MATRPLALVREIMRQDVAAFGGFPGNGVLLDCSSDDDEMVQEWTRLDVVRQDLACVVRAAEDERGVGSAEAEGVCHGVAHGCCERFVPNEVEVAGAVEVFDVRGGWGDLVAQGKDGDAGFEAACSAEQMTRHRLG